MVGFKEGFLASLVVVVRNSLVMSEHNLIVSHMRCAVSTDTTYDGTALTGYNRAVIRPPVDGNTTRQPSKP